ncbi:MAG: acetyl-CoA carboxylase biotin carboxyl carrier protein [Candidatus Omnitrophica bacterium]|nr:acetyl-CoA carboxylase biotin carboxyl carrier protein [Candidatus Omnitrophota bacterium]
MNLKEIEEMIKLMNENKLCEIEIEKNGLKIRLKKEGISVKRTVEEPAAREGHKQQPLEKTGKDAGGKKIIEIKAPMIGTFFRSPAPDVQPFVEVGQTVKPDDVLCIIEAMKLMNEIKSEAAGKIIKILGENGGSVEYGQVIFLLEPEE